MAKERRQGQPQASFGHGSQSQGSAMGGAFRSSIGAPVSGTKATGKLMALKRDEVEVTPRVVTGTFLVNNKPACVLFDSRASHSFVASSCVSKLLLSSLLEMNSEFAQPSGERILCQLVYKDIPLNFMGIDLRIDLIEFALDKF